MSVEPGPNEPEDPAVENFLPPAPQVVLDRHGGRVLNPEEVWVAQGRPTPRSTVYKANSLLVPQRIVGLVLSRFNDNDAISGSGADACRGRS